MKTFARLAALLLCAGLGGCAVFPAYIADNQPLPPRDRTPSKSEAIQVSSGTLHNGVFVGLAISGGGSRAANFAAAALFELQELGILDHVSAISSVSGGSLAAAYYRLNMNDKRRWEPDLVRKLMRRDFELWWEMSWLSPLEFVPALFTYYDRDEHMAWVFDAALFHGRKFRDLPPGGPVLLLNSTMLTPVPYQFTFDQAGFGALYSDQGSYPLANAVMASAAFPGAFRNITLEDFEAEMATASVSGKRYIHVFDGGASDNLGASSLFRVLAHDADRWGGGLPKACFAVVVDADTEVPERRIGATYAADRRVGDTGAGFLLDKNALVASGLLMHSQHSATLGRLGYTDMRSLDQLPEPQDLLNVPSDTPLTETTLGKFFGEDQVSPAVSSVTCRIWSINFRSLQRMAGDRSPYRMKGEELFQPKEPRGRLRELFSTVTAIDTRFYLTGPPGKSSKDLQDALFTSAHVLVQEDPRSLPYVCAWFSDNGLPLRGACASLSAKAPPPGK